MLAVFISGHFYLTNLLADKLRASAPSRVINVTCASYSRGRVNFDDLNSSASYNPATAYAQSKLANVLFTKALAARWQGKKTMMHCSLKVYTLLHLRSWAGCNGGP